MIKRIIIFSATIVLLFFLGYFLHQLYLDKTLKITRITPLSMYSFHAIATIIIYLAVEAVFKFIPNETGYLYLGSTMMKIGVFILLFQNEIFSDTALTPSEKALVVFPLFIFLIAEAAGVGLLLNKAKFKNSESPKK